jgi:DNA-binding Xre family transcriptional regulator
MPTAFRLRELLDKLGVSQTELARLSGVSFATINRLCTNATAMVYLETLDKIAGDLKVEPGELIVREKRIRR